MEKKEKREYATFDPEDIKAEFDRKYGPDFCEVLSKAIKAKDPEMKHAFTPEAADEFLAKMNPGMLKKLKNIANL